MFFLTRFEDFGSKALNKIRKFQQTYSLTETDSPGYLTDVVFISEYRETRLF